MILPTKHIRPHRSLLGIGGVLLTELNRPRTVTALWERARETNEVDSFQRFALALDLLHALGTVQMENGFLRRTQQ